ncbi:MAG: response regulator transcription factor, partial [Salinibacter sp.]
LAFGIVWALVLFVVGAGFLLVLVLGVDPDREMAVVQMLGQGYSVQEIQDRLSLSRQTIETHRRRAKERLGGDTVSELLQHAVQWTYGQGTHDEKA